MTPKHRCQNCFVVSVILFLASLTSAAQVETSSPSRFMNFENSPLNLEEFGNGHKARNMSSKTVVKFTLGCLDTRNGKPGRVILKFPTNVTNIPPGHGSGEVRIDSPSSSDLCAARKAKLTVIDVTFSDASQGPRSPETKMNEVG